MPIMNMSKGTLVADKVTKADTFFARLKGLLGTSSFPEGEGVIIYPCSSVHTFGMNYAIDVLFINSRNIIVKIAPQVRPWRIAGAARTHYVIELPAGTAERTGCQQGDRLQIL